MGNSILTSKNELVTFLKNQIKIENEIVVSLNKSLTEIKNSPVKGVLKGISLDSIKHAEMYSAATELLLDTSQALKQENLDEQTAIIKKHILIEAELIQRITKALLTVENKKVKLLLNTILEDERIHHQLLKSVLDILVKGETITADDWWDTIWKNVPFHGAPGG